MNTIDIIVTENTYFFIENNSFYSLFKRKYKCGVSTKNTEYILSLEINSDNVKDVYNLIFLIFKNMPSENNRWILSGKEYPISSDEFIKYFLLSFEGTDDYPLERHILSDIIKNAELSNIQQAKELADKPFSGILHFDQLDILRLFGSLPTKMPESIEFDHQDINIKNRYISNGFKISNGKVSFRNCIIDGDITISGSSKVEFSQCIITGKIKCFDIAYLYLSSVNMKLFYLINSNLDSLRLEYSKIYRFVFHSCAVKWIAIDCNEFVEPYIANLSLPSTKEKIDMSQFAAKNISDNMVKRINKDKPIRIKNEKDFYLSFLFRKPITPISPNDIALDMVDIVLTHGDLNKKHTLYSNMKYKRTLYSNMGWRRAFVFLTGAFYIPSRWILFIVLNMVIFTALFVWVPSIQFVNVITGSTERLNFWTAVYYSICQIIGSNPAHLSPIGNTQIYTTIQSILNTVFITNFFASLIRKFMRD